MIGYYRHAQPVWKLTPNVLLGGYPSDVLRTREMASPMPLYQSKLPSYPMWNIIADTNNNCAAMLKPSRGR